MKAEEKDNVVRYNASIVICNWRYATFGKVSPQGKNSADRIQQAGCKMRSYTLYNKNAGTYELIQENSFEQTPFTLEDNAIPVRICDIDEVNLICSDWCTSGSPFKELNYDSIPRWWPQSWIFKTPGVLPDRIEIDLGILSKTHIILDCEVIKKPTSEVMCTSFSDIFIEGVDDLSLSGIDRRLDNDKDKNDDIGENYDVIGVNDMFGKKTKQPVETTVQADEPKSEISKILEMAEQINDAEENPAIENNVDMEDKDMSEEVKVEETTPKAKKERNAVPLWAKITGGVVIVAAATTATVMIVNKVKGGSETKKNPSK